MINCDCDVVVAGSGPAGLTASMYLARAGYSVINVMGINPGGNLVKISNLENYPGVKNTTGYDLWETMVEQCKDVGVQFAEWCDVISHEKENDKSPNVVELSAPFNDKTTLTSRAFIECVGGKHKSLNLPDEHQYYGNGISYCASCDGPYYKNKTVIVVGGGNTAFDDAITLSKYCKRVIVIHRRDTFRASQDMINKARSIGNISYINNSNVIKLVENSSNNLCGVVVEDKNTKEQRMVSCDGVFYAIGFEPNYIPTRIGGLNSGNFSAGDVNNNSFKQVITACGDGCSAALECIQFLQRTEGEF